MVDVVEEVKLRSGVNPHMQQGFKTARLLRGVFSTDTRLEQSGIELLPLWTAILTSSNSTSQWSAEK